MASNRVSPDSHHPSSGGGVGVELREDLPLKARDGAAPARCCAGGPRLIIGAFATLTAAITLALLTQIYYGDYELVPHGSVSSSAAACSRAGTDALKEGGRAIDAAAAASLCLAVLAPHRTSLDASGAMLYWEYRDARTQPPFLFEWGAVGSTTVDEVDNVEGGAERAPRLVVALASLHAQFGALPWARLLTPAIQLAKNGYEVSEGLSAALVAAGDESPAADSPPRVPEPRLATAPALAQYLTTLLTNTSAELSAAWGSAAVVRRSVVRAQHAGSWRVLTGGAGGVGAAGGAGGVGAAGGAGGAGDTMGTGVGAGTGAAARALIAALEPPPASPDDAQRRVVSSLQSEARAGGWAAAGEGVATGLAAVDRLDTYVALVTGLSVAFGSGPLSAAGWRRDQPRAPLDLAPAILLDEHVCGTRYVLGAESSSALAQGAAALATEGGAGAVERARVAVLAGGALAREARRPPPPPAALPPPAPAAPSAAPSAAPFAPNASLPYAAVNLVQQRADALASHADSRGGGLASRF